jgi:hypothetical protein
LGRTETVPPFLEPIPLSSAGEYRVIPVYVTPGGELRPDLRGDTTRDISRDASCADWLMLDVSGVVEDEPSVMAALEKLTAELGQKYRRVSSRTKALSVLEGISTHPLAGSFLRVWEEAAPRYAEAPGIYELARLEGLLALKEILEKRR